MTRKIRTPAELDALPRGVVLTSKGVSVAVKLADGMWGAAGFAGAIDSETVVRCAHGYLSIVGNITAPAPAPSVVPEAAVEAAALAVRKERAFSAAAAFGVPMDDVPQCAEMIARTALTAALPFLTAAPSATREEVARTWVEAAPESGPGAWERASERARERSLHRADALLARFNITPKEGR